MKSVELKDRPQFPKPIASDRMVAELPHAQKVTIQPGGHMALMEQNRQFAEAVQTFCDSLSSRHEFSD